MDRWRVSLFGDRLHVITDEDVEALERQIRESLAAEGIQIMSLREARFSLEDVFISVVEKARLANSRTGAKQKELV
jgi:ABC-2 type transport system ATP-binding protein